MLLVVTLDVYSDWVYTFETHSLFQHYTHALSEHEWRNFKVSFDETNSTLTLKEIGSDKIILSYTDENPLKLLYLFVRSSTPALWKIHESEFYVLLFFISSLWNVYFLDQFMYAEEEGTSNFGPPIKISSSDLCVSLYAFMCNDCSMDFLIENDANRKMFQEISNVSNCWNYLM